MNICLRKRKCSVTSHIFWVLFLNVFYMTVYKLTIWVVISLTRIVGTDSFLRQNKYTHNLFEHPLVRSFTFFNANSKRIEMPIILIYKKIGKVGWLGWLVYYLTRIYLKAYTLTNWGNISLNCPLRSFMLAFRWIIKKDK